MSRPRGAVSTRTMHNAADRYERHSTWVRTWTPATLLRWCGRHRGIALMAALSVIAVLVGAARASAQPLLLNRAGDGNALISWMGITDSDQVPVAKYTLTLNQGGWTDPTATIFYYLDSVLYEIFLCVTTTALWLIKTVMSFQWMTLFTVPFETIGAGINDATTRFGLAVTAVAVLAMVVVVVFLAGKTARAFSNIAMGVLMMGLAATIFANPLAEMVGPDGLLAKGRDTGLQIATSVSGGTVSSRGTQANVDDLVSVLADRFLRSPTQMINFGVVSDSLSRQCREAWSKGIKNERGDELKDDIKGCDDAKGAAMHQKSMGNPAAIMVPLVICGLLAVFLIAFACYFVWHVVRAAVQALLFAALAPPAFAIGVIPGGPQTFAWKTVLDCAMAYVAMIVYTAAFGGYNVVLDRVFAETTNPVQAMFTTSLVLAFGFAFFGPLRRMFDRQRDTMAAKLGRGPVSSMSQPGWFSRAADLSRIKQEVLPGGGHSAGRRGPGRIEAESEPATTGGGGEEGPVVVTDPASGGTGDGSGRSDGSTSVDTAPDQPPAPAHTPPQPVVYLDGDRAARAHDRLAEALRRQRGSHRGDGGGGPPGGSGGRHSLSEAA